MAQLSDLIGEQSVEDIGVTLNSSSAAAANVTALNAWANDWDESGRRQLTSRAGKIYVNGAGWVIPRSQGGCILKGVGGATDIFGSTEGAATNTSATIIIGANLSIVVDCLNGGAELSGLAIWGDEQTTRIGMLGSTATWSDIGLLIRDALPSGSSAITGTVLSFGCCVVGLQCGTDDDDEQADNLNFQKLLFTHCTTGIRLRNQQSVNHRIGEAHFYGCETCFSLHNSCDISVDMVYVGAGDRDADGDVGGTDQTGTVIKTTGFIVENSSVFTARKVALDGTSLNYALVVMDDYANPAASNSLPVFNFLSCRLPASYTGVSVLRGGAEFNLFNTRRVPARMVQCHAVTDGSTYTPVVNYTNCRFASGVNTDELIHASSTGTCTISLKGCTTALGARVSDQTQTWIDGVKQ